MTDQEQRLVRLARRAAYRHSRRLDDRAGEMLVRQAYELYFHLCRRLDRIFRV